MHVTDALPSGAAEGDGGLEWASFRLCLHRGQTRFRPAGTVLWWRPHGILLHQVAAFQAQHLPHPRRRHRCLHRFLHSLAHVGADMALAMVQAAAVDVAGGDEVDLVDVVAAWVSRADETSVRTHRIRAVVPVAARFVGNASRYCQTWP